MRFRLLVISALLAFAAVVQVELGVASTPRLIVASATSAAQIPMFDTEQAAQKHCPSDEVVWLNTNSGIYHEKGMRWYGRTKQGAFVCRKEADAAGYRDTRNGQ
jgi:hypothetical protein